METEENANSAEQWVLKNVGALESCISTRPSPFPGGAGELPSDANTRIREYHRKAGILSFEAMEKAGFLSFEAARTFARTLKLGSVKEWYEYSKSGKRPSNIPGAPDQTYRDAGWISMPDWLGYEAKEVMAKGGAASFKAARTFVRTLKLGNREEWRVPQEW